MPHYLLTVGRFIMIGVLLIQHTLLVSAKLPNVEFADISVLANVEVTKSTSTGLQLMPSLQATGHYYHTFSVFTYETSQSKYVVYYPFDKDKNPRVWIKGSSAYDECFMPIARHLKCPIVYCCSPLLLNRTILEEVQRGLGNTTLGAIEPSLLPLTLRLKNSTLRVETKGDALISAVNTLTSGPIQLSICNSEFNPKFNTIPMIVVSEMTKFNETVNTTVTLESVLPLQAIDVQNMVKDMREISYSADQEKSRSSNWRNEYELIEPSSTSTLLIYDMRE